MITASTKVTHHAIRSRLPAVLHVLQSNRRGMTVASVRHEAEQSSGWKFSLRTVRRDLETLHELGLSVCTVDGCTHFWSAVSSAKPVVERCRGCGAMVAMPCVACK